MEVAGDILVKINWTGLHLNFSLNSLKNASSTARNIGHINVACPPKKSSEKVERILIQLFDCHIQLLDGNFWRQQIAGK